MNAKLLKYCNGKTDCWSLYLVRGPWITKVLTVYLIASMYPNIWDNTILSIKYENTTECP